MDEILTSDRCLCDSYRAINILICSGRSKEFIGRNLTAKDLDAMTSEQMDANNKFDELVINQIN